MTAKRREAHADIASWHDAIETTSASAVDPVAERRVDIEPTTRVSTVGSCFARALGPFLRSKGCTYFVAEEGHPLLSATVRSQHHYGTYSARHGDVHSARHLRQLLERAFGTFVPAEPVWIDAQGRVLDPFRPDVQSGGFESEDEMRADREQHLRAVRRMFEEADVFVIEPGRTECWRSKVDGAVFPEKPPPAVFDAARHEFFNQGVLEVERDLIAFRAGLKRVNPRARIVLAVSPLPQPRTELPGTHVLTAHTHAKSVLRVAVQTVCNGFPDVHYFPSYEIATGAFHRGAYVSADLASVTQEGLDHMLRVFLAHAAASVRPAPGAATNAARPLHANAVG